MATLLRWPSENQSLNIYCVHNDVKVILNIYWVHNEVKVIFLAKGDGVTFPLLAFCRTVTLFQCERRDLLKTPGDNVP